MNKLAIHLDVVMCVGLCAEVRADLAVDGDPPGCDQFVALPARPKACCGEETVEAHNRESKFVTS